jgi:uncharacterized lipoprotein YajG
MPTVRPIYAAIFLTLLTASLLLAGCSSQPPLSIKKPDQLALTPTSDAFLANGTIPVRYTCDGE